MKLNNTMLDVIAMAIFIAITILFFGRLYSGDVLVSTDIVQYQGMSSEIHMYKDLGNRIHWTNAAYGGMPTYLVDGGVFMDQNIPKVMNQVIRKTFPGVAAIMLIGLVCFFILMRTLKVNHWLAIMGSFVFMSGTFVITSLLAGHTSKLNAFAYAPLILAGLLLIFKKRYWAGVFLLSFGLAAHIAANHLQITFYTFLLCLIYVISELIRTIRERKLVVWKPYAMAAIGVIIGVGVNFNGLYTTYQHAKYTTRSGESAIVAAQQSADGKDAAYDYATQWSYTPLESLTLIIPNFMGGSSNEELGEKSSWYGKQQLPRFYQTNPPTYWGQMPFTGGPVYLGAVLFALFFFGIQFVKNRWKWWAIAATVLFLLLSWGKFFPVYDMFYFGFPFFDKFRTPMMALLMLSLTIPLVAFLGTNKALFSEKVNLSQKHLLIGFGVPLAIVILFGFLGRSFYGFEGAIDENLRQSGFPSDLMRLLKQDRQALLSIDSFRSLIFILLLGGLFWLYIKQKVKKLPVLIGIGLLLFLDLFLVNQRYLSADAFTSKAGYEQQRAPNSVNNTINEDEDLHFRVFDVTRDPFNNALTSFHHSSLGGYHAAKLQNYQDLIETRLAQNDQVALNMLNTKYFIGQSEDGQIGFEENDDALGNAWLVNEVKIVADDTDALSAIQEINPAETAVVARRSKFTISNQCICRGVNYINELPSRANGLPSKFRCFRFCRILRDILFARRW